MKMASIGVTLLSGGLDSTTVTAYARDRVERLTALTFHYGQTHSGEVRCAGEVARRLGVQHEIVDISGFAQVAWYSSLISPDRFPLPRDRRVEDMGNRSQGPAAIPISYVPLRNTFFLAMAGALLESQALYAIEVDGIGPAQLDAFIFLAPNAIDYSGYPDCRPEYYEKIRDTLMYGSKLSTQYRVPIQIETPIIDLSKAEIVEMAMGLDAPLEQTWSCYSDGEVPCGQCDSCILRAEGFGSAGYKDPLLVRLGVAGP